MLNEQQQKEVQELIEFSKNATFELNNLRGKLTLATKTINLLSERLEQATKDNNRLVAFIKGRGIKPPKIHVC